MKKLILVLMLAASCFALNVENYTGYGDTANIHSFNADSLLFTPWFRLSSYLNLRVDVFADDTSSDGFASDSILFHWGVQTGHPVLNSSNTRDTMINEEMLVVDTMDVQNGAFNDTMLVISATGSFSNVFKQMDTTNVSGFVTQTANVSPEWDVWFRGWVQGLTGNKLGSYILTRMAFPRRVQNP